MRRDSFRAISPWLSLLRALLFATHVAQTADSSAASLKTIHAEGIKHLSEPQLIGAIRIDHGSPVGKTDLQAAADRLVQTGLFSTVN